MSDHIGSNSFGEAGSAAKIPRSIMLFNAFVHEVSTIVNTRAGEKGYDGSLPRDQPGGKLMALMRESFPGHSMGEVVYKAIRYQSKRNLEDLVKIAAWAFLEWANATKTVPGYYGGTIEGSRTKAATQAQTTAQESPSERSIEELVRAVVRDANAAVKARPDVMDADPVRLVALVAEEAGEALKEALDATRGRGGEAIGKDWTDLINGELRQTASMALIAIAVLESRR